MNKLAIIELESNLKSSGRKYVASVLSSKNFTRNAGKAGLAKKGCGIDSVVSLQALIDAPASFRSSNDRGKPCLLPGVGKLIAAGLAVFQREHGQYIATDAGRKWIEDLKSAHLIG